VNGGGSVSLDFYSGGWPLQQQVNIKAEVYNMTEGPSVIDYHFQNVNSIVLSSLINLLFSMYYLKTPALISPTPSLVDFVITSGEVFLCCLLLEPTNEVLRTLLFRKRIEQAK